MGILEHIEGLRTVRDLSDDQFREVLLDSENQQTLFNHSDAVRQQYYGKDVYIRGLIEISNFCQRNCYYCGIRKDNNEVIRYRLSEEQILSCCRQGYEYGFRTFVLQGGEDDDFSDDVICRIVSKIRTGYPDCAITLSLGEKSYKSYKAYYNAGADRYLLRHETANEQHYKKLHPLNMSAENRKRCLWNLKEIGYQVGAGFMVGSPFQTIDHIIEDLRFLQQLQPHMVGIGPYITHKNTPFGKYSSGDVYLCLRVVAVVRLILPNALIPSTTALGSILQGGRELGIMAGANVVMPNLSPQDVRSLYQPYDNKLATNEEAAESLVKLKKTMADIGYEVKISRGDWKK